MTEGEWIRLKVQPRDMFDVLSNFFSLLNLLIWLRTYGEKKNTKQSIFEFFRRLHKGKWWLSPYVKEDLSRLMISQAIERHTHIFFDRISCEEKKMSSDMIMFLTPFFSHVDTSISIDHSTAKVIVHSILSKYLHRDTSLIGRITNISFALYFTIWFQSIQMSSVVFVATWICSARWDWFWKTISFCSLDGFIVINFRCDISSSFHARLMALHSSRNCT